MSTPQVAAKEPSPIRMILTLAAAGLFSGTVLAAVFEATLPLITENKARALREAVFDVVPGATRMEELIGEEGALSPAAVNAKEQKIYAAYGDDGRLVGYGIPGKGVGFQDFIELIWGYDPASGNITGMRVLDSRETPGLGDKIFKDEEFVGGFRALSAKPEVVLTKKGEKSAGNEIDAITGATISSRAVVKIINAGNSEWLPLIEREAR